MYLLIYPSDHPLQLVEAEPGGGDLIARAIRGLDAVENLLLANSDSGLVDPERIQVAAGQLCAWAMALARIQRAITQMCIALEGT